MRSHKFLVDQLSTLLDESTRGAYEGLGLQQGRRVVMHVSIPKSLLLRVRWVQQGAATDPTVLAFTGFGHRLDPWQRLKAPGWRVGVVEFPVGTAPTDVWTPEALAAQVSRHWALASHRALLSFSYGGAGATAVADVMSHSSGAGGSSLACPDFAAYVAPVQWARAPWSMLKALPESMRLKTLRGIARGSNTLLPLAGKLGGQSVKQFAHIVDRYVGWDFVAHYLPYIDWIGSPTSTLGAWNDHPWPSLLVGARRDTVIPVGGMQALEPKLGSVEYLETDATHFNALDAARGELLVRLAALRANALTGRTAL